MNNLDCLIKNQLEEVLSSNTKSLLIYSGISSFGVRLVQDFKISIKELPLQILSTLKDFLGPNRNLVFPTYTFQFTKTKTYDKVLSKSEVGVLSQATLARDSFFRTNQAIYNCAISGPQSHSMLNLPSSTAWGRDSAMGWFYENDIAICTLGIPWEISCSFFHAAEELVGVPYRYFKRFSGQMSVNGNGPKMCQEVMYVRSLQTPAVLDYLPATLELERRGLISKTSDKRFPLQVISAKAIQDCIVEMLLKDPYIFVKNIQEVKNWEKEMKSSELKSLTLDQHYDI